MVREYTLYTSSSFKFIEKFYCQACGLTWKLFCVCIKSICILLLLNILLSHVEWNYSGFLYIFVFILLGAHWILWMCWSMFASNFRSLQPSFHWVFFPFPSLIFFCDCHYVCWDASCCPLFRFIFPQSLSSVFLSYMVLIDLSSSPVILSSVIWNLL